MSVRRLETFTHFMSPGNRGITVKGDKMPVGYVGGQPAYYDWARARGNGEAVSESEAIAAVEKVIENRKKSIKELQQWVEKAKSDCRSCKDYTEHTTVAYGKPGYRDIVSGEQSDYRTVQCDVCSSQHTADFAPDYR